MVSTRGADGANTKTRTFPRWFREPTLHFFVIAGIVLAIQRSIQGDPRTIELSPALKADLLRRFGDQLNRAPTAGEAEAFMTAWKADEALYREALREGIDRDDATVRGVLIARMRERMLLKARPREPTRAELDEYLAQHRSEFEAPGLYEHEYVVFEKSPGAEQARAKYHEQLSAGATPAALGLRSTAANVDRERIARDLGQAAAAAIPRLAPGQWQALESDEKLLLVRLIRIQGGLPPPDELRARLSAAWRGERAREVIDEATRAIAAQYRLEEARP